MTTLMYSQTTHPDDATISPCSRFYETAIKFIVDTPVLHPFTVSDDGAGNTTQILFSSGNLQYCANYSEIQNGQKRSVNHAWRFAPRQFDFVGDADEYVTPNVVGGNVYYDSVVLFGKGLLDPTKDSFYYVKRLCNNNRRNASYQGWIDLLPWGSSVQGKKVHDPCTQHYAPGEKIDLSIEISGNRNKYGVGPSWELPADSIPAGVKGKGSFDTTSGANRYFDWGYNNSIREYRRCTQIRDNQVVHYRDSTMYRPNVWRTPTTAEWKYLLQTRTLAEDPSSLAWSCIELEDTLMIKGAKPKITGILLYPDDFSFVEVGIQTIPTATQATANVLPVPTTVTMSDWELLELAGCIFLPTAYYYNSTNGVVQNDLGMTTGSTAKVCCAYWACTYADQAAITAASLAVVPNTVAMSVSATGDGTAVGTIEAEGFQPRPDGLAVRLVQDFVPKGL